ncbi:uncharacterized protein LOC141702491 [Apium graveolens]|uniref:uncharacterized protein LOC141702491 n=1 Tax=Apium graveolens TaxID=4045 RepID=UPI003D7B7355
MVYKRGIEENPAKIKAILDMEPPKTLKDVQKLTGRVTALGRFISKSREKCLPFFKALKKVKDFIWTEENQEAFKGLKMYMVQAPLLAKLDLNETLCLRPDEARLALEEVHEGIYRQHFGGRALKYAPVVRKPPEMFTSINSPIPFAMWGMDILGPFSMATTQKKFMIVAIDYFTKWIEAKPLAKITTKQVAQFLWENIMSRYGIPRILVIDNGTQFNNEEFKKYCEENEIG